MQASQEIWGLTKGSKVTEAIVRHDGTATRYRVRIDTIDLIALRGEKADLEAQLVAEEPGDKELKEWGKTIHPWYRKSELQARLDKINEILGE